MGFSRALSRVRSAKISYFFWGGATFFLGEGVLVFNSFGVGEGDLKKGGVIKKIVVVFIFEDKWFCVKEKVRSIKKMGKKIFLVQSKLDAKNTGQMMPGPMSVVTDGHRNQALK